MCTTVTALFCTLESMHAYLFYSLYKLNLKAQSKSDLNHCIYSFWRVNFRSVSTMILSFPGTWHFQSHCPYSSLSPLPRHTYHLCGPHYYQKLVEKAVSNFGSSLSKSDFHSDAFYFKIIPPFSLIIKAALSLKINGKKIKLSILINDHLLA